MLELSGSFIFFEILKKGKSLTIFYIYIVISTDVIAEVISQILRPNFVVFVTDVPGVFDIPPSNPNARLLPEIVISKNSSEGSELTPVTQMTHEHDVTGGT